jgi:D-aminoacyl-tRNA deacylase
MRAVIQRVKNASVAIANNDSGIEKIVSKIDKGILTLLGFEKGDTEEKLEKMIQKIVSLRIFEDENGKMNLSLSDMGGQHLIVSQFTLLGDCNSGRRPSFVQAELPERAKQLYNKSIELSLGLGIQTYGGVFQADMKVALVNDGPVTFTLEQ